MGTEANTTEQPKYAKLFLIILSAFFCVFLIYQIFAIYNLNSSQEKIKQSYVEHIRTVDSMYCKLNSNNKTILSTYMHDSLYNTKMELLYNEFNKIIKEDSLRLLNERMLIESQTKTMIDLHLNKVEHEYSNLTIWAAVLTILFLVFSFYSIYKIDELIVQGNEGVKDIRRLKKNSEDIIERLENTSKFEVEKTRNKIDNFVTEQQQRMLDTIKLLDTQSTLKLNEINKCFEDACVTVEGIKAIKNNLNKRSSKK